MLVCHTVHGIRLGAGGVPAPGIDAGVPEPDGPDARHPLCIGGSPKYALWGELMSTRAHAQGDRVIDYDCPIEYATGVVVEPGDLLFGDLDGVVVVPRGVEADVIDAALGKVRGENKVRETILGGMGTREAFDRFRIM
jgi:regulator of RNase E activity RraA